MIVTKSNRATLAIDYSAFYALIEKSNQVGIERAMNMLKEWTILRMQETDRDETTGRSLEGNFPAPDTETLIDSLKIKIKRDGLGFHARFGVGIDDDGGKVGYAAYLEYGTERMGFRPWLRPAIEEMKDDMLKAMAGK